MPSLSILLSSRSSTRSVWLTRSVLASARAAALVSESPRRRSSQVLVAAQRLGDRLDLLVRHRVVVRQVELVEVVVVLLQPLHRLAHRHRAAQRRVQLGRSRRRRTSSSGSSGLGSARSGRALVGAVARNAVSSIKRSTSRAAASASSAANRSKLQRIGFVCRLLRSSLLQRRLVSFGLVVSRLACSGIGCSLSQTRRRQPAAFFAGSSFLCSGILSRRFAAAATSAAFFAATASSAAFSQRQHHRQLSWQQRHQALSSPLQQTCFLSAASSAAASSAAAFLAAVTAAASSAALFAAASSAAFFATVASLSTLTNESNIDVESAAHPPRTAPPVSPVTWSLTAQTSSRTDRHCYRVAK
jgi:hypothetical protein